MFETLGQDPQGQRLHLSDSVRLVSGITEHPREIGNFGDPPAILFAFELNLEGHMGTLAPERRPHKRLHSSAATSPRSRVESPTCGRRELAASVDRI